MMISRRKLIGGLGLLIAAPAVIRVAQLMPVKAFAEIRPLRPTIEEILQESLRIYAETDEGRINDLLGRNSFLAGAENFIREKGIWPVGKPYWPP